MVAVDGRGGEVEEERRVGGLEELGENGVPVDTQVVDIFTFQSSISQDEGYDFLVDGERRKVMEGEY